MKRTSELSNKTKAELTAMARRKKIPVVSGMVKDELIKAIKKGLRKIEAQKKSRAAAAKTRKRTPVSKAAQQTSKKKSSKTSKVKTARKPKSAALKKSPAKGKTKKAPAKKSAKRKPKTARSSKTIQSQARPQPVKTELPERYGDHRLVVLARDPNWAYAYWDLNPTQVRNLLKSAGQTADKARWILRVYAAALHPVEDKKHYFDVNVGVQGGNYYLNLSRPGARFIVEIGVMDVSGLFRATAQSNPVIMALDHPSETLAQESTFSEDTTSRSVSSFTKPPSSRSQ